MSSNKVVRVTYCVEDVFYIPKNINLEDKTQVESWGIKYNVLHIYLANGKKLEISSRGDIHSFDYKYPSNFDETEAIVEASEEGYADEDDEGFNEVDVGIEKPKEEEEEDYKLDNECEKIYKCVICSQMKRLDDIICIELEPKRVWKCCDCIAKQYI